MKREKRAVLAYTVALSVLIVALVYGIATQHS